MMGFNQIPSDARVPLFYAEVDNSMANSGASSYRRLIVGQVNDEADHSDIGRLVLVSRTSEAVAIGGDGSPLAAMHKRHRQVDGFGEVWCLPLAVTEGTAAKATVTITGQATESGLVNLYIAGTRVRATVARNAAASVVASTLVEAINGTAGLPVSAAVADAAVELTCKFKGSLGNDIQLQVNRLGRAGGESLPAGLIVTPSVMAGGTGEPDMAQALAALGDEEFEFITMPWTDTATLDAWQEEMNDSTGRWAWSRQIYGHVYTARRGALGEHVAAGRQRNDPHVTLHGFEKSVPEPSWEVAASYAARTAVFISADPARPTQTGECVGINPAEPSDRFMLTERQSLLQSGVATATYSGGAYRIERAVTTYQRNAYGQPDDSYLDSETLHQSAYVIRYLRSLITSKYGRHKLANDGTNLGDAGGIVTPKVIKGELIGAYRTLEKAGIVENAELFKQHLIVERNATNPNRVDVLFPPDLVNQLRIFALLYQFRLQYDTAA